ERCAVDGAWNGPLSRWQPAQPVAAEPTKVGLNDPRLDEVTAVVWAPAAPLCGAAAADPPMATRSIAGRASSDSSATLGRRAFINGFLANRPRAEPPWGVPRRQEARRAVRVFQHQGTARAGLPPPPARREFRPGGKKLLMALHGA